MDREDCAEKGERFNKRELNREWQKRQKEPRQKTKHRKR